MKLELKHLAPYLPYGLKYKTKTQGMELPNVMELDAETLYDWDIAKRDYDEGYMIIKPILRPLSDLTEYNARFLSSDTYLNLCEEGSGEGLNYFYLKYNETTELFKRHYDVFGLIEKILAIDINTLT
jgi:hypothetical protein